jgi:hypothetical protein
MKLIFDKKISLILVITLLIFQQGKSYESEIVDLMGVDVKIYK